MLRYKITKKELVMPLIFSIRNLSLYISKGKSILITKRIMAYGTSIFPLLSNTVNAHIRPR